HEVERLGGDFFVYRLHALPGQWAGILDAAVSIAFNDAARAVALPELRILGIVRIFRLFLRVQVVKVAIELVEAVVRRQHVVAVTQVVLAELAGHVALGLEHGGNRRVFFLHALRRTWQPDLGEARADGRLSGDERRAAGGATLLAVPVGEDRSFLADAVDVGRLVAHHAHVVGANVELADVVAPDDKNVRFGLGSG